MRAPVSGATRPARPPRAPAPAWAPQAEIRISTSPAPGEGTPRCCSVKGCPARPNTIWHMQVSRRETACRPSWPRSRRHKRKPGNRGFPGQSNREASRLGDVGSEDPFGRTYLPELIGDPVTGARGPPVAKAPTDRQEMGFAAREFHAAFDNSNMHNTHKWDRADMAIPQSRAVSARLIPRRRR